MAAPASTVAQRPASRVEVPPWLDVSVACAGLAATAQFVSGFVVGHSFRVPRIFDSSTRFVHDPVASLIMGAVAAATTLALVRFAVRAKRPVVGLLVCVAGSVLSGALNAFLSITLMTSMLAGMELGPATVASADTIQRGLYRIPPGAFWVAGPALLAYLGWSWRRETGPMVVARAVWAGALVTVAHAEAALLVFGPGTWPRLVGVVGALAGLGVLGWSILAMQAAARDGTRAVGGMVARTALGLAAAQVWVAVIWLLWRK